LEKEFFNMINATKKWIFLKASSIVLIPLMTWFIINLVLIYDKDYADIMNFFSTQPSKFLTSILMIVAFFYSSLSISEIFEDYIQDEKIKNFANKALKIFAIIIPLFVIIIIFNLTL
tara:strand:- start:14 stop:364 length:351 start_codon:yes stop_codon:yes gene_type:complete